MVGKQEKALTGYSHLVKMLPTGTVFLFQFLNPAFTNDGKCHVTNKWLTGALFVVCGVSCVLSCFTDSFTDTANATHHGFATIKGIWTSTGFQPEDPAIYKIRPGDFVRAFLSLIVFAVVSLLDSNTIKCFYPSSIEDTNKVWIMALPVGVGTICSTAFVWFPDRRHGVGYSLKHCV
ncbi:protein DMP2-like [Actinidia eriantha]|uniref:protein DMP2-like n=1 Tax=Actinidia eriantha TaxID=165200 RepID=UPI00258BB941|nr:protein DMP2-like [Actinidia eriantha]